MKRYSLGAVINQPRSCTYAYALTPSLHSELAFAVLVSEPWLILNAHDCTLDIPPKSLDLLRPAERRWHGFSHGLGDQAQCNSMLTVFGNAMAYNHVHELAQMYRVRG